MDGFLIHGMARQAELDRAGQRQAVEARLAEAAALYREIAHKNDGPLALDPVRAIWTSILLELPWHEGEEPTVCVMSAVPPPNRCRKTWTPPW